MFEGGRLESDREHSFREIHDSFEKYRKVVDDVAMLKFCGKVKEVIGSLVISEGPFASYRV